MRLLVIEDQASVAGFIVKGLREESYAVDQAADGKTGYELACTNEYDVIILDVMLPELNGFELLDRLRGCGDQTPVLMLTAKDAVSDRVKGLDLGADDYLTKPFAFDEFLARIRALLRRGGDRAVETVFSCVDLELDPQLHEVRRAGQLIDLTPKEYSLLDYLLRNKGRVLTRTSIIEHVWDIHFDSDTNVVDVYIRYLRRKIDEPFAVHLIQTVRGRGYVLREPAT